MAKKQTSYDYKIKWNKGLEELEKLQKQKKDLDTKIEKQVTANQDLKTKYITSLLAENDYSIEDLEDLLLNSDKREGEN